MKKFMMLGTLLAATAVAFANTAPQAQTAESQPIFGAKSEHHKGEHKKHGDRKKHSDRKADKQGGFFDESKAVKNLADVKTAADDSLFVLDGYIVKQVGKNDFIFKDQNGMEQEIEISKRAWHGETVTPADKIQIRGKIDKDFDKTELEVKQIQKLK